MKSKSAARLFYVYAYEFYESEEWIPRYIGRGHNNRMTQHLKADDFIPFHIKLREHIAVGGTYRFDKVKDTLSLTDSCLIERFLITKYGRVCKGTGTLYNVQPGGVCRLPRTSREALCNLCDEAILIVQESYRAGELPVGSDDFSTDSRYHVGIQQAVEQVFSDLVGDFGLSTYRNNIQTTMRDWVSFRKTGRRVHPEIFSEFTKQDVKRLAQMNYDT